MYRDRVWGREAEFLASLKLNLNAWNSFYMLFQKHTIFHIMRNANAAVIKRACGAILSSVVTTDVFSV